jgi:hypothetical protein
LGNKARAFEGFQLRLRMTKWEVALLLEGLKELKETKIKLSNEAEERISQLKIEEMVQHDRLINEGQWDAAGKLREIRTELKLARKQHFNMWEKDAINILINRLEAIQQGKIRHSGKATTLLLSVLKSASQPQPSQVSAPIGTSEEATQK